jgi:protein-S-isoprenylcysteine O-methyltransferase Ste14
MKKLILPTLQTAFIGLVAFGLLLFLPAGTLNYWQAWVFILVFIVCTNYIGLYLSLKDPTLLERRKKFGPGQEQNPAQRVIMSIMLVCLLIFFITCALDHRFGWSHVPVAIVLLGDGLVALGLYLNLLVFKANSFGGSSIEVVEGQQVISSGPYALVRHPMYSGVLVMVSGVPLALGSWWGLLILAITLPALVLRIRDEEKTLAHDLNGYAAYAQRVKYRLVPGVW